MKASTVFPLVFATAAWGAGYLSQRQNRTTGYEVFNLVAGCIPHSFMCSYEFRVVAARSSSYPTQCEAILEGPDFLPPVDLRSCENQHYSWAVERAGSDGDGTLTLSITTVLDKTANLTGFHIIGKDDLIMDDHGSVTTQRYVGPENFTVPVEETSESWRE